MWAIKVRRKAKHDFRFSITTASVQKDGAIQKYCVNRWGWYLDGNPDCESYNYRRDLFEDLVRQGLALCVKCEFVEVGE